MYSLRCFIFPQLNAAYVVLYDVLRHMLPSAWCCVMPPTVFVSIHVRSLLLCWAFASGQSQGEDWCLFHLGTCTKSTCSWWWALHLIRVWGAPSAPTTGMPTALQRFSGIWFCACWISSSLQILDKDVCLRLSDLVWKCYWPLSTKPTHAYAEHKERKFLQASAIQQANYPVFSQ